MASKAGFLPLDHVRPADPAAYFRATYVDTGLIPPGELVANCHSIAPRFLADQLARSRANTDLASTARMIRTPSTAASYAIVL